MFALKVCIYLKTTVRVAEGRRLSPRTNKMLALNSRDQRMILRHDSRICDCSWGWKSVAPMPGDWATAWLADSGAASSSDRTCSSCNQCISDKPQHHNPAMKALPEKNRVTKSSRHGIKCLRRDALL